MTRTATVALVASLAFGCSPAQPMPPLSPQASAVGVDKAPPPPDAREIGDVLGEHGSGCGFTGKKGSYDGAEAVLRERTAAMGGDYARILEVDAPVKTTDCLANRWVIHAVAYRTAFARPAPPEIASSPVAPSTPPAVSPAVVSAPSPGAQTPAPPTQDCNPPCSPGYACAAGLCKALCNPACGPDQLCRQDRTCAAAH